MMFPILSNRLASNHRKRGKLTCTTCKLKGCLGRCKFEVVASPHPPKAA
jgi:hypothetical protein